MTRKQKHRKVARKIKGVKLWENILEKGRQNCDNLLFNFLNLKVGGNEKNGGSGRSQMLDNGLGPWRSRFIFKLNMQFLR